MKHSRSGLIVALAIVIMVPTGISLAGETPITTPSNSGVGPDVEHPPGGDSADLYGPRVATNLTSGQVFRGRVEFGGTATDPSGLERVRIGIRDRATGKWLQRDGRFRRKFSRIDTVVDSSDQSSVTWRVSLELAPGRYAANIRAVDTASNGTTIRPGKFRVKVPGALLAAAGDVAECNHDGHHKTAALLDTAFSQRNGVVALLGDGAYLEGSEDQYTRCYDPSWGRHKHRTRPAVGNHDYQTPQATGYYGYFGARAGDAGRGYYAYDLQSWRVIVLNSECEEAGGCSEGSPQYSWLKYQLANTAGQCVLTYSHRPRYTSGPHPDEDRLEPLWSLLYEAGTDVALAGHSHNYQRFKKMDAAGDIDSNGIRSFVVGTGGVVLKQVERSHPGMKLKRESQHGVLLMQLNRRGYTWEFVTVNGEVADSGRGSCD